MRNAQRAYADFSQEQVDKIFAAAAAAANKMRIPLAKMAVEETGMLTGVLPSVPEFDSALEEVSPALRKVVEKACAFEPSARYASACELAQAVRAAVPAPAVSPTIQKAPQALLAALRNTHERR